MNDEEELQEFLYKAMTWDLLMGEQGFGKGMAVSAAARRQAQLYKSIASLDNVRKPATISADRIAKPTLPQKICTYRKPKLEWYGKCAIPNFIWNPDFTMSRHWEVTGDTVEAFKGKRFVAIDEPTMNDQADSDFLKRFTGEVWEVTKPMGSTTGRWKPQGKIFVTSGQPLKMHTKDKETIERVRDITFPEAP